MRATLSRSDHEVEFYVRIEGSFSTDPLNKYRFKPVPGELFVAPEAGRVGAGIEMGPGLRDVV